jgi:NitT/TauT family transport system permease protein
MILRPKKLPQRWMSILLFPIPLIAFLLLWEFASRSFGVPQLFPDPKTTGATFLELSREGVLWSDAVTSLARIAAGYLLGSTAGIGIGLLCSASQTAASLLSPYINFLRFISGVAWISIFIVWFGIGETSKILLVAYTVAFTVALSAFTGLAEIKLAHLRAAAMFGATPHQVFIGVRIPTLIRGVITGMRLALGNAFLVIVAAEMVQADSGLGFSIIAARNFLAPDIVFAEMLLIGLLGFLADRGFVALCRLVLSRYTR